MKKEEIRATKFAELVNIALENKVTPEVTTRATTQLVKARPQPCGQSRGWIDGK